MCTLTDERAGRYVEVVAAAGRHVVRLGRLGGAEPFFEGRLDRMLMVSSGRPWAWEFPGTAGTRCRRRGDTLRLTTRVGALRIGITFAFEDGLLVSDISWENTGEDPLREAAVGVVLELREMSREKVTIPNVSYNNNPSASLDRVVPKLGNGPDGALVVEEHRLPIPCVNVEWEDEPAPRFLSLFSVPRCVRDAAGRVAYGSLGARRTDRLWLAALSGVLAFNGVPDTRYVHKGVTETYDGGYLDLVPGMVLRKRYVLDWGTPAGVGQGFREVVRKGRRLFPVDGARPLALEAIIGYKTAAMDARWCMTGDGAAGYRKFNDAGPAAKVSKRPAGFLYGWTGQCLKLAWCDARIGLDQGDNRRLARCRRAVEFYLRGSPTGVPGLRNTWYDLDERSWSGSRIDGRDLVSSRAHGETIGDLADLTLLFRDRGRRVPAGWIPALREAADFFCGAALESGIFPIGWTSDGVAAADLTCAAGLPAVLALAKVHRVTGREHYLTRAEGLAARYHDLHAATFERPFARATLDAAAEDKESGLFYFLCMYELYRITGAAPYRERAHLGADWLQTYVYRWNPEFDRGTPFDELGFKAAGWPGVSVQNHHLDAFFPAYELAEFGRTAGIPDCTEVADVAIHAMGQGISTRPGEWGFTAQGEQGEGFFQTDWQSRGTSNTWNPSWVVAQVLSNALRIVGDRQRP